MNNKWDIDYLKNRLEKVNNLKKKIFTMKFWDAM